MNNERETGSYELHAINTTRTRVCLAASAFLMVVGHCVVIGSGAVIDPRSGEHYNVFTSWVSDFAAKWPEGLWVKGSIAFFCLALADFFRAAIGHFSSHPLAGILKFWWLLLATAMVGGLALVVVFDVSHAQFQLHGPNWFSQLLGDKSHYEEIPRSAKEWSMHWHHQLGFKLFVTGFFLSAISFAWSEWRAGSSHTIPTTAYLLLLAFVLAGWLFATQSSIPGIPQRALLVLVFVWLLRGLSAIAATPKSSVKASPAEW